MKKKLLLLLVVVSLIASVAMFTACSGDKVDDNITKVNENTKLSGVGNSIFNEVAYMSENYKNRTYGGSDEAKFATYLTEKLTALGYDGSESQTFAYHNVLSEKNEELKSTNVVFKKDNPSTDKCVLITSQIDNMYSFEGYGDEGVYNGTIGVAIMLELAKNLKDVVLPFDVYFVGFGANSMSFAGASKFYKQFYYDHKKVDTLLMIDLSKPVGGDHMYMYYDEADTIHGKFFDNIAKASNLDFRKVPKDKKITQVTIVENQPMNYSHIGTLSSNIFFLSDRIPTVNFLSINWENKKGGEVVERKGSKNIVGTELDNFKNLKNIVGEKRISNESDMVYTVIYNALTDNKFMTTMQDSINNMPDYTIWSSNVLYICLWVGIGLTIIVAAILISSRLKKNLPSRSMEEFMKDINMNNMNNGMYGPMNNNSNNVDPFSDNSSSNDPFDEVDKEMHNTNKKDKKDDGDDIFGI